MRAQLPGSGAVFLDHVAWFVADMTAAERALTALGFTLTPFTEQTNAAPEGPVSAGMANRCAMLRTGYLEFLTAVGDTPLARQFQRQIGRYAGLHLLAFTVADAEAAARRLRGAGFDAQAPVRLRRRVTVGDGRLAEAAFTVIRVPPEAMPEGRIQLLTHHTPEVVWQPRWTAHANAVESLEAALLAVAEPAAVAARFGRFLDRDPQALGDGRFVLALDRGALVFAPRAWVDAEIAPLPASVDAPVIAAVALGSADLATTGVTVAAAGGLAVKGAYALPLPPGGAVTLVAPGDLPTWAR